MTDIKGLIFDAGDVIFDATLWRKWLYDFLLNNYDIKLSYEELFFLWDNYYLRDIHLKRISYSEGFERFLIHLGLSRKQMKVIIDESINNKKIIEKQTTPYKWVYEYFPKIKSKSIKMGILTDSENTAETIRKRYDNWQISKYIDVIVSSADNGYIKPYRESYLMIVKKLHISINEAVFIGHDRDELLGAKILGIKFIDYFNKKEFYNFLDRIIND